MGDAQQKREIFQYQPGKPVTFYLHPSIRNEFQRENLIRNITDHGGKVLDVSLGADTVLVDEKKMKDTPENLQLLYSISRVPEYRQIVVEPMRFVQDCLRRKDFFHDIPIQRGMGGYVGRSRTNFTKEDDDNLCWYLSRRIPDPANGGRSSTGVYKELMSAARNNKHLQWANRHTIESWRERYKKNRDKLDPIIRQYALRYPPEPPAYYGLNRRRNKNPSRALKYAERDDGEVIEISDSSAYESEKDSDLDTKSPSHKSSGKDMKPSKRRRIDSSDISSSVYNTPKRESHFQPSSADRTHVGSSPQNKGKGKEVSRKTAILEDHYRPVPERGSPEPGPSQPRWPVRSPARTQSQRSVYQTPAPTATLVQQPSPLTIIPPSTPPANRSSNLTIPPSAHPSTSFHNVVHSSPNFIASPLANKISVGSGITSVTEPSSRSMVVPVELVPLPLGGTSNAPAESSITRESSHKRSSPIPVPLRSLKAVRKHSSRRPTAPDEDESQEVGWAPYRNTRSRSRSIEPPALPAAKKRKRRTNVPRNNVPLDPVQEGGLEQEQTRELENVREEDVWGTYEEAREAGEESTARGNRGQIVSTTLTETMQDEQNVMDILMPDPNDTSGIFGAATGTSTGEDEQSGEESRAGEETEDEGEGERLIIHRREEEEEEEEEKGEIQGNQELNIEEIAKFKPAPGVKVKGSKGPPSDQGDDENAQDLIPLDESDDEIPQKFTDARLDLRRPRQPSLESDDAQINQMIQTPSTTHNTPGKTAQEVLALYDSSPEAGSSPRQRKPFNSYRSGSPSPLQRQNQNRPRQSLPILKPTQMRVTPGEPKKRTAQAIQKQANPQRVSFGSSPPSLVGTLPRPSASIARSPGSQNHSPKKQPVSPSQSQLHRSRRGSVASSSSDLVSFPISGTRASAVKQSMEQELKESPYTPPSGTKAAQIVAARRRLRPRKQGKQRH